MSTNPNCGADQEIRPAQPHLVEGVQPHQRIEKCAAIDPRVWVWRSISSLTPVYIPPSHSHIFGSMSDTFLDLDPVSHTSSPAPTSSPPPNNSPLPAQETIGDALRKALAPNRRDGPGFVRAIERFNEAMREIQADGSMQKHLADQKVKARDWSGIVEKVNDMAYARVVGPYSNELEVSEQSCAAVGLF